MFVLEFKAKGKPNQYAAIDSALIQQALNNKKRPHISGRFLFGKT
jgi:hypothetical protein